MTDGAPFPFTDQLTQQHTVEIPFEIYKGRQAALAIYRLYPVTVFYTLYATVILILGLSTQHPWIAAGTYVSGCFTWAL